MEIDQVCIFSDKNYVINSIYQAWIKFWLSEMSRKILETKFQLLLDYGSSSFQDYQQNYRIYHIRNVLYTFTT
uniref:Uncharacterized protein n=1 Tax=Strongyloides venezuelensis TaxID=75913 RepID=A0A0K0FVB1_STRVS